MTDLHTHILPGMDDGAPDVKTSLQMLEEEAKQGVETVALTPHFYRNCEHISDFLERRAEAMKRLESALPDRGYPKLILSAEVAYLPGMCDWPGLERLCFEGTRLLLVEPPMTRWNDELYRTLYAMESRRGITPMIAHFDRYIKTQSRARIRQMLASGFPVQISTAALIRHFGRGRAVRYLSEYNAVPVTDCHNITTRPPNMGEAARILEKKLGGKAAEIMHRAGQIQYLFYI